MSQAISSGVVVIPLRTKLNANLPPGRAASASLGHVVVHAAIDQRHRLAAAIQIRIGRERLILPNQLRERHPWPHGHELARLKRLLKTATASAKRSDLSRLKPEDARKTVHHLQLVSELLRRWRELSRAPAPERLLDGRDIMKALKIPPGPRIGELLERVREAQAEGEVKDRDGALALITRLK